MTQNPVSSWSPKRNVQQIKRKQICSCHAIWWIFPREFLKSLNFQYFFTLQIKWSQLHYLKRKRKKLLINLLKNSLMSQNIKNPKQNFDQFFTEPHQTTRNIKPFWLKSPSSGFQVILSKDFHNWNPTILCSTKTTIILYNNEDKKTYLVEILN